MSPIRTGDELETLKADLRSLRSDLREIARDVGDLTTRAARSWRRPARAGWFERPARWRRGPERDLEETWAQLRARGERSAEALRETMHERPMAVVLGAVLLGCAIALLVGRQSADR